MAYEGRYKRKFSRENGDGPEHRTALGRFADNHIRLIAALCTIAVLLAAFFAFDAFLRRNAGGNESDFDGDVMKMQTLQGLSMKTPPLTWEDFKGKSFEAVSSDEGDEGTYVLRRYKVEGGVLSVMVGGYVDGEAYTGNISYAEVKHKDEFDFSFSLIEDDDLLSYLEDFPAK